MPFRERATRDAAAWTKRSFEFLPTSRPHLALADKGGAESGPYRRRAGLHCSCSDAPEVEQMRSNVRAVKVQLSPTVQGLMSSFSVALEEHDLHWKGLLMPAQNGYFAILTLAGRSSCCRSSSHARVRRATVSWTRP